MTGSLQTPSLNLGGGSSGNGSAGTSDPGQLALTYQNLLSGAADIVSNNGAKVLVLASGAIGLASHLQIGSIETAPEQAANLQTLANIAAFCRANGIVVQVDTVLTNTATYSDGTNALTDMWAQVAAQVGLPIASVENVNEIGFTALPSTFANYASIEVNAVQSLIKKYANSTYKLTAKNLAVGDMAAGGSNSLLSLSAWWSAYDTAAQSAGLSGFAFVTLDTGLFAPWVANISYSVWQGCLTALSTFVASHNMTLNVIEQGTATDLSGGQFVQEAEQNAIELAKLQGSSSVKINALALTSWDTLPVGVGEVTSPTSVSNEAAEIRAVYPLYQSGSITAQGAVATTALAQIILNTGSMKAITPVSVQWDAQDVQAGGRLGVVIIDQTGTLTASRHGSGTVSNLASNILILSGNSADLAAELSSIKLQEAYAGPDTIDVEIYGSTGRLSDNQISVYAAATNTAGKVIATSNAQGWISSSAIMNTGTVIGGGSLLASETLYWNTTGTQSGAIAGTTTPGQSAFVKVIGIHEPLAEYGVENAPGTLLGAATNAIANVFDPKVDSSVFETAGYANNKGVNNVSPTSLTSYTDRAFNAVSAVTGLTVRSTTLTFNPTSGKLETSVDDLTPDPITVTDKTGTHLDTFATAFSQGGSQVTQENTGNNPNWQAGWGNQFSSATLTYDGSGKLVEEFLQGGPSNPLFSIDDVFDPSTGQLWEQFQSSAQPPKSPTSATYATTTAPYMPGYDTGPVYVTQFNTGNNPNWDYIDWSTASLSNTEMWTDYFLTNDFAGFAVKLPSGLANAVSTYPLQFVNGATLDLINMPGTISVNLNALGTVTIQSQRMASGLSHLSAIDAWGATGTVNIVGLAAGGSTLVGGNNNSTITGFGKDIIFAGAGHTSINTGQGASTITISSANGNTILSGDGNTVTAVTGSTLMINGKTNRVNGSGVNVSLITSSASATVVGNSNKITAVAGAVISVGGTNDTVYGNNINVLALAGTKSIAIYGNGNTITTGAATQSVVGSGGILTIRATSTNAGVAISNGSGRTTLEITTGGTVMLNAADANLIVAVDASTNLTLGKMSFITAIGSIAGHDTIVAGGVSQTLQSIGGNDTLVGSSSYGDKFQGTAASLSGDFIKNFGGNDVIDITDLKFMSLKLCAFNAVSGTLQVADATHGVHFGLSGPAPFGKFTTINDGHGGTLINLLGH